MIDEYLVDVELHGGVLDGFEGQKQVKFKPGETPTYTYARRYVYKARDFCEPGKVVVMDLVQVLFPPSKGKKK